MLVFCAAHIMLFENIYTEKSFFFRRPLWSKFYNYKTNVFGEYVAIVNLLASIVDVYGFLQKYINFVF